MAGTKSGAEKARATMYAKYGKNVYRGIGKIGGHASKGTGFALMPRERVQEIGRKGGSSKSSKYNKTIEVRVS